MTKLKVSQFHIENVLGITEFDLEPGQVTVISGKNGEGKTSILEAWQNVLGGGSLAELTNVKTGDKPQIVLRLQSDETEYIIKKTGKSTSIKKQIGDSAAYEDVPAPQRLLSTLYDGRAANPIKFLQAKNKELVDLALKAIDLPYDAEELRKAMGLDEDEFPQVGPDVHPLAAIQWIRDAVFNTRTGINRDEKSARVSCEKLLLSIPAEIPTVEGLADKEAVLEGLQKTRTEEVERAESKKEAGIQWSRSEYVQKKTKFESEFEAYEDKLRLELEEKLKAERVNLDRNLKDAEDEKDFHLRRVEDEYQKNIATIATLEPTIADMKAQIATLKEREKNAVQFRTLKDQARIFEGEAEGLKEEANRLTEALNALDGYKASMCSELPIKGLEIKGEQMYIDGVKWSQLNTAQKISIAVKICALRSKDKDLRLMFIDGAEALDSETLGIMAKELEAEGVQAVFGKVSDSGLEVDK